MAIIDPDGLFHGDRLSLCSDQARLLWPYLFLASNGFGRLELDYRRIINTAFDSFTTPPTESELAECIREYHQNYLLFPYEAGGKVWGQWDTDSKYLPRHKSAKDRKSPSPPENEMDSWKKAYIDSKSKATKEFKTFQKFSEIFGNKVRGVGVGVGVGVGGGVGGDCDPTHAHTEEDDMRATKQIPITCLQILGVKAERWDSVWDEVKELVAAFGDFEVNQAFETWAETRKGEALERPVSEFLKVAVGMLRGDIQFGDNEELVALNAKLYATGGQPFTGKYYQGLATLLKKHPVPELAAAYKEFVEALDDFERKMAPKRFIEGGAESVILARKTRAVLKTQLSEQMDSTRSRLREEAEAVLAAKEQARREEEEIFEDELPSG